MIALLTGLVLSTSAPVWRVDVDDGRRRVFLIQRQSEEAVLREWLPWQDIRWQMLRSVTVVRL